ncbi:uncharacterized protein METZ01_LOCUS483234, partial [marine metagenome]
MCFAIFTALFCVGSLFSITAKNEPNVILIY